MKNPLTPAGIELATFRFVAQHLNHCATAVPVRIRNADKYGYDDLHYLYYPNITSAIKSRMRRAGHVERLRDGEVHTGFWWGNLRKLNHFK